MVCWPLATLPSPTIKTKSKSIHPTHTFTSLYYIITLSFHIHFTIFKFFILLLPMVCWPLATLPSTKLKTKSKTIHHTPTFISLYYIIYTISILLHFPTPFTQSTYHLFNFNTSSILSTSNYLIIFNKLTNYLPTNTSQTPHHFISLFTFHTPLHSLYIQTTSFHFILIIPIQLN